MADELDDGTELKLDQALLEFLRRFDAGNQEDRDSFLGEHPDLAPQLRGLLEAADWIEKMAGPTLSEMAQTMYPKSANASFPSSLESISPDDSTLPPPSDKVNVNSLTSPGGSSASALLPCRFGDYMLEKVLGRGGMGVVYLAYQVQLHRRVAIKMIRSGCLASDDEVQRFYVEARSAASLDHPNIVTVYQCGECDGHHFFSMDFVPGTDLAKLLSAGPLKPRDAARYARDIAMAVDYAHKQGVVHRDLKPANVLIDESDQVVLTDFGLAKKMGSQQGLTATGAALGTPSYMSPEQASGRSEDQGASTDVYAIGAILYALLTGKPPFQAESILQTIMQVIDRPAPTVRQSIPSIDSDLDTIVTKCLEKSPARRFASAMELAEDLDRYLEGRPILARPPSFVRRAKHWLENIPIIAALTGKKNIEPTSSQRIAQNAFLVGMLSIALLWVWGRKWTEDYRDSRLPNHIAIASSYRGGMYYEFANKFATSFGEQSGKTPEVIESNGSYDNLKQLLDGHVHLAMMQESAIGSEDIAVIAPLFYEAVHVLVRKDQPIERFEQLTGTKICIGLKDSGTRKAALRLLKHFDIDESQLTILEGDWTQTELRDQVDAMIVVIKEGQQRMVDLLNEGSFRLLPIDNRAAMTISLESPMFHQYDFDMSRYSNATPPSCRTLATRALLVTKRTSPSRLVQESLMAIYDNPNIANDLFPKRIAANWQELPYHEAARRFYSMSPAK